MKEFLKSIDEILKNGIYEIPKYQRYYAWDKEQAKALFEDLLDLPPQKEHFFGTVIFESTNTKEKYGIDEKEKYHIVDGQQRLTTSILLLKAFFRILLKSDFVLVDKKSYELLFNDYLYNGREFRFNPHSIDSDVFKKLILLKDEEELETAVTAVDLNTLSGKRLFNVFAYFEQSVNDLNNHELLKNFNKFRNCFMFLKYGVNNEQDAVRIFNTTNDRGINLSYLDKTKSWAIYYCDRNITNHEEIHSIIENINLQYSTIIKTSNKISNNTFLYDTEGDLKDEFNDDGIQRYHYVYFDKDKGAAENQLYHSRYYNTLLENFKKYRDSDLRKYIYRYFSSLKDAFTSFEMFLNEVDFREEFVKIIYFNKLSYVYPLICALYSKILNNNDKKRFLNIVEILLFRVYAIGGRGSRIELYNIANDYFNENLKFEDLLNRIKKFIEDNQNENQFLINLLNPNPSHYSTRYFFIEYENYLRDIRGEIPISFLEYIDTHEIEHIIASDFTKSNDKLSKSDTDLESLTEADQFINQIGNMTLAPKGWNASWGCSTYKQKAFLIDVENEIRSEVCKKYPYASYETSSLWVQKDLTIKYAPRYQQFTKTIINKRYEDIKEFAIKRWSTNNC